MKTASINEIYSNYMNITKAAAIATGERDTEAIEEICMESVCKFLEQKGKINKAKGKAENYLYTIAKNETCTQFKKRKRQDSRADFTTCSVPDVDLERQIDARNRLEACEKYVTTMRKRDREIYRMLKEGYTTEEISQELDMSQNSVYMAIHYLRKELKSAIA